MKILLIAGHGAGDSGAVCKPYKEADETRNVVGLLMPRLARLGIDVDVYPTTQNAYSDYMLGKFTACGKPHKYDYVLEIHFNACTADGGDGKTKGVECYVTTSESGIGVETAICKKLSALGLTNRGVKRKNWAVINACKTAGTSAALLEVCFIDDADDMKVYTRSREAIADAIADGIREGFNIKPAVVPAKESPSVWAAEACNAAIKAGYIKGDANGNYGWQTPITLERMLTILHRMGLLK